MASALTIRRYDQERPIALYADEQSIEWLKRSDHAALFAQVHPLPPEHRSIVGFKHHLHQFHPFDACLFVDADMIWCKNPNPLWKTLSAYEMTGTGVVSADLFFGGPKKLGVVFQFLTNRRQATINHFDVTYLPRIQAGMLYSRNKSVCQSVCEEAQSLLARSSETHFRSRLNEGRNEESCEWSLALAFARLNIPILPWNQGRNTPQMDYIEDFVVHDNDFEEVSCRYFNHPFVHRLRELQPRGIRNVVLGLFRRIPGKGDFMDITPFTIHFGWLRYKDIFYQFADRMWVDSTTRSAS